MDAVTVEFGYQAHNVSDLNKSASVSVMRTEQYAQNHVLVFDEEQQLDGFAQLMAALKTTQGDNSPFYVMDLTRVERLMEEWRERLPRVRPFYSLQCNNNRVLLQMMADQPDIGFSCSNRADLELASELVGQNQIIYNVACMTRGVVRHAQEIGVQLMSFDNEMDLDRISSLHSDAELLLRIMVNPTSPENDGFNILGCNPHDEAKELLTLAATLGAKVVGISFNVGPGCQYAEVFHAAIKHARRLFDYGLVLGLKMNTLDIGGGFPGYGNPIGNTATFTEIAVQVNAALELFFDRKDFPDLRVMAEPGRYFAASSFMLVTNIVGKEQVDASQLTNDDFDSGLSGFVYQTNEGFFGSFGCRLMSCRPVCKPLFERMDDPQHHYGTIIGPSMDTLDVIQELFQFRQMHVGDWLLWKNMGAYSQKNRGTLGELDFLPPPIYYMCSHSDWIQIQSRNLPLIVTEAADLGELCCEAVLDCCEAALDVLALDEVTDDDECSILTFETDYFYAGPGL